jgi:hypothetical protein
VPLHSKKPLTIGHLSSSPAFVGAYLQPSAPMPNFPAAPAVPLTTQPKQSNGRSPSPSFCEASSVQNRDTDTNLSPRSTSPPLTAKGLSERLTATRAALSKSGNIAVMTMGDLELFRQQQMLLQTNGGGVQGTGGGQSFGNGTINGGGTLSMLAAEAGGFSYSMADTGQNLPFLLSSHNAALLEEDPVRRPRDRGHPRRMIRDLHVSRQMLSYQTDDVERLGQIV